MKKLFVLFAAVAAYVPCSQAQYFNDMFAGSLAGSTRWTTRAPYSDSSVSETGGYVYLNNRGLLLTQNQVGSSILVSLKFAFTGNSHDDVLIMLRTNGASASGAGIDTGMAVTFRMQSDPGDRTNNVTIMQASPNNNPILAQGTFPISLNQLVGVQITDDGTNVAVFINGSTTPLLTASNSIRSGYLIGMYNREGAAAGSSISAGSQLQISDFSVDPIPVGSVQTVTNTVTNTVTVPGTRFINMSTITASGSLTTGFVVTGTNPEDVLLRVGGPALAALSVPNPATQTSLVLYNKAGTIIASNSGWGSNATALNAAFLAVGAFAFPAGSTDSALLVTLQPGSYTAAASGNGAIILEAYEAP